MRLLIDTHAFLWFVLDDPRLSVPARDAMSRGGNELFLSIASVWEMTIKASLGRLPLPEPVVTFIPRHLRANRVTLLEITPAQIFALPELPPHHRDPFDRLLVAQAMTEALVLVSGDAEIAAYPVARIW